MYEYISQVKLCVATLYTWLFCHPGGAATSKEVMAFMKELFDNSYVSEGYGCTEVGYVTSVNNLHSCTF